MSLCFAVTALATWTRPLHAQSPSANRTINLNYVYAANLGFGGYSLGGLTADLYALPFGYTLPVGSSDGLKLRFKLPVQLGIYRFRAVDTNGARIRIDQQSLAIVPGVELQIPIAQRTVLKPFADLGVGHGFGVASGADILIYTAGVRSVTQWQAGEYKLSLGAGALYAGDTASDFNESYSSLQAGFEVRRPLGFSIQGVAPDLGIYAANYYYPKPLRFSRFLNDPLKVSNQNEVGFSIGVVKPFDMLLFGNARIGVGYVFGGGLNVWHASFGFPF
jgi:hypothetical protein